MRNFFLYIFILISMIHNATALSYGLRPSATGVSSLSQELRTETGQTESSWIQINAPQLSGKLLATFSMEGYIPELSGDAREANAQGGLGFYFGDKLEGLAKIGMPAVGCMPLYAYRRIQQIVYGKQYIDYAPVDYTYQPLKKAVGKDGSPIDFVVWGWDKLNTNENGHYNVKVYEINRAGTPLYLFYCPEVFDILYSENKNNRYLQQVIFARCVYELFDRLGILPNIIHFNEGHVADIIANMSRFDDFEQMARVYTNHSVAPGTLQQFRIRDLDGGDPSRIRYIGFPDPSKWDAFIVDGEHGELYLDFSKGALRECDVANAVSAEHADVCRSLFPWYGEEIVGILNGSGDTWVMDELLEMERKGIAPSKEALKEIHGRGKVMALDEVKRRTGIELDQNKPTVWLVRRIVKYKSQYPVLKDIIRLICADRGSEVDTIWVKMKGLGMQVVVGGIAPVFSDEELWIEEFLRWMDAPGLKGRFVYVSNSDTHLIKMQAIGADICINSPLPRLEASGTSDQRSARNGGINIATGSGGPPEYIEDGESGFLVGPYRDSADFYANAPKDILGKLIIASDMYYSQRVDTRWIDMMHASYTASEKVTASAMEKRYAIKEYIPALIKRSARILPDADKQSPTQLPQDSVISAINTSA